MLTPATLPCNAFTRFCVLPLTNSSDLISWTEYPSAFFSLLIPNAVTTTSPNSLDVELIKISPLVI